MHDCWKIWAPSTSSEGCCEALPRDLLRVEEGSPGWHSTLESIELSLRLGDIRDSFKTMSSLPSSVWTLCERLSSLSLSGSYLEGSLLDDHSEVDLLWCCLPMEFLWSLHFVMSRSLEPKGSRIMNDRASPAIFAAGNRQGATGSNRFVFVNLGSFGVCKTSVREKLTHACDSFDKRVLKAHEVQSGVTCLDNQLDCSEHRSSPTDVLAPQEGA